MIALGNLKQLLDEGLGLIHNCTNFLLRCDTSRIDKPVPAKSLMASAVFLIVYSLRIDGPA